MVDPSYIHLPPEQELPKLSVGPFKAVVIIDEPVTQEWRDRVSEWLVQSGCLYMLAWGHECSMWDDSVDYANLDEFEFGDIPDDKFVMTTWHDSEPLSEVFWFAANGAVHPGVRLEHIALVHVATQGAQTQMLKAFHNARVD